MKLAEIRSRTLDALMKKYPELKSEADALYVQADAQLSQRMSGYNTGQFPAALIQKMTLACVRFEACEHLIANHPNLKSEADALYVQFDGIVTQEIVKAQQK